MIVTIHKIAQINVTPSPPVQCWLKKIKSKQGLVQMIINIVWVEGGGGILIVQKEI